MWEQSGEREMVYSGRELDQSRKREIIRKHTGEIILYCQQFVVHHQKHTQNALVDKLLSSCRRIIDSKN